MELPIGLGKKYKRCRKDVEISGMNEPTKRIIKKVLIAVEIIECFFK